jgi:hypothetical protein
MRAVMVAPAVEAPVVIGLDVGGTEPLVNVFDSEPVAFEALDGAR